MLVRALAKCSPQRGNLTSQIVLIDRDFRPHAAQKLILADDVVSVFEEDDEYVECL